ncbi:ROK family transcriptional regulator [Ectobacillus antri]|jgi:N-acetylglucosamine repressor|uniref:ROK family transcriptional regulator n=1 Tax=Ectobacillus antri TaxID=2486280 RepID=A0ABT6H6J8_9BACI|nr:ROK family transcriptional regulator [Ectobacillus antri]MDG4656808.1 ROK family transcriptional regulator [Ectobacillus antri]MDG5754295.1 ROK family transcriptional regulator [Ectobacillus antri]
MQNQNMRKGNKAFIKEWNRYLLLEQIRLNGPISRSELAKVTKMGLSTVTNIVEELLTHNLIKETGTAMSTGGRKPILLQFNETYQYAFGVKIEETKIRIALTNLQADILQICHVPFAEKSEPDVVIHKLVQCMREMLVSQKLDDSCLCGVGIAASGLVDRETGTIVRSSMLGWENVPICQEVSKRMKDISVFLDKNINAFTLAELHFGQPRKNFVCLSVGAGLGMTTVIDGNIYYGEFGGAGEFGHTTLQINGYRCHCGKRGCLEMYASEPFFKHEGKRLHIEARSYTFEHLGKHISKPEIAGLFKQLGVHLGYAIANIINTLNPAAIVLTGEGMKYAAYFLPYARAEASQNFFAATNDTEIVVSLLSDDAWLQGAALLVIREQFQLPLYERE